MTFCCYVKTPRPNAGYGRKNLFGLRAPVGWESIMMGRCGGRSRIWGEHVLTVNIKQRMWTGSGVDYQLSKPVSSNGLPPARLDHLPKRSTSWEPSVYTPEPMEGIVNSNRHTILQESLRWPLNSEPEAKQRAPSYLNKSCYPYTASQHCSWELIK